MDIASQNAFLTVARFSAYYGLGTLFIMAGLSFDGMLCFRVGALLILLLSATLLYQAWRVPRGLTTALPEYSASSEEDARKAKGHLLVHQEALETAYVNFARWSLTLAIVLWIASLFAA